MKANAENLDVILCKAVEISSAEQRGRFLDEACDGNSELRAHLEELVQNHFAAGSFLDHPPVVEGFATELFDNATQSVAGIDAYSRTAIETSRVSLDFLNRSDKADCLGTLGPYEISEPVGHGGMGVVLKGQDAKLNRVVAIKVLAPELASNATARKRFRREAQAAAAVTHPHVVTIFAVEEADRLPYLVMEYVNGQSLRQRIDRDGPLQLSEILRIGQQIAAGLAAAHAQGLIHRDVKPANVLLENGVERVKITDFGLARAVDDVGITQTGEVAGTPQYMSPEQAQGATVDHRSDLFSLGSVLYAMCTGRSPFRAETTVAALRRVCDDTPRPIREINPEIPQWLVDVVEKLLAKDPDERFQSAEEVADVLGQHLAELQYPSLARGRRKPGRASAEQSASLARSTHPEPDGSGSLRLRRRRWMAAAVVLAVLLGGLGLSEATGVTRVSQFVATVLRIKTPEGTLVVKVDDPNVKVAIEGDGGLVITGAGPQEVRLEPGQYRLKATKDGQPVHQQLVSISQGDKEVVNVHLQRDLPDGDRASEKPTPVQLKIQPEPIELAPGEALSSMALISEPSPIEGVGGWTIETREHRGSVYALAYSPDGRWLASVGSDATIRIRDAETGRLHQALLGHDSRHWKETGLAWSPTGRYLASAAPDGLRWWATDSGRMLRYRHVPGTALAVDWSPDGRLLATGGADGVVRLWDAVSGEVLRRLEGHTNRVNVVAFSPDGTRLASRDWHDVVHIWNPETGELHQTLPDCDRNVLSWSPHGQRLATAKDESVQVWQVATGQQLALYDHGADVWTVRWAPEGQRIASAGRDGRIRLWNAETHDELRTLISQGTGGITVVAWAPDGASLASADQSGTVCSWNVDLSSRRWSTQDGQHKRPHWQHDSLWQYDAKAHAITVVGADNVIRRYDAHNGQVRLRIAGKGTVRDISQSPDGKLAAADVEGTVAIWELDSGELVREWHAHRSPAWSVDWSPDGKMLATGGADRRVKLWDARSGELVQELRGHDERVHVVAWSPDAKIVASGSGDKTVRLWNAATGQLLHTLEGHGGRFINALAWSPDGDAIASSAYADEKIRVWNVESGGVVRRLGSPGASVLCWSPDGRLLASGTNGNGTFVWNVETGEHITTLRRGENWIEGVSFSPDGRTLLAYAMTQNATLFWDVQNGRLRRLFVPLDDRLGIALSPTGHYRAPEDAEKHLVYVVQTEDGQVTLTPEEFASRYGWTNDPNQVSLFAPESVRPQVSEASDHVGDGEVPGDVIQHVRRIETGYTGAIFALARVPGTEWIVVSKGGTHEDKVAADVWDLAADARVLRCRGGPVRSVAVAPDGSTIALGTYGGPIRLVDPRKDAQDAGRLEGHQEKVNDLAWSANGEWLVSGSEDRTARVWDPNSGREIHKAELDAPVIHVEVAPDGTTAYVRTSSETRNRLYRWDLSHASSTPQRFGPEPCGMIACSPNGRRLAVLTWGGSPAVLLLDADTGDVLKRMVGHSLYIRWIRFSPDGRFVFSSSQDNTIRCWSCKTGEEIARAETWPHVPGIFVLSNDGRRLVSGDAGIRTAEGWGGARDTGLHVWELPEKVWPENTPSNEPAQAPVPETETLQTGGIAHAKQPAAPPLPEPKNTDN